MLLKNQQQNNVYYIISHRVLYYIPEGILYYFMKYEEFISYI